MNTRLKNQKIPQQESPGPDVSIDLFSKIFKKRVNTHLSLPNIWKVGNPSKFISQDWHYLHTKLKHYKKQNQEASTPYYHKCKKVKKMLEKNNFHSTLRITILYMWNLLQGCQKSSKIIVIIFIM